MSEFSYRLRRFLYQEFIPVTKAVALLSGVIFLLAAIFPGAGMIKWFLALDPVLGFFRPWTMVAFPLFNGGAFEFLTVIFGILWLWFIGGSLERNLGSKTYGLFLFLATLVTGVSFSLLGFVQLIPSNLIYGLWLPLTGLTWAWAKLEPDRELLFWGLVPIKARWLAWITAAITFFNYSLRVSSLLGILSGLAAVSGIAVAYLFTGNGPFSPGYGYYARQRKASSGRWGEEPKRKPGRRRLRVIK